MLKGRSKLVDEESILEVVAYVAGNDDQAECGELVERQDLGMQGSNSPARRSIRIKIGVRASIDDPRKEKHKQKAYAAPIIAC